jgi:hypothetical protein
MKAVLISCVVATALVFATTTVNAAHKRIPQGHHEVPPDKCPLVGSRPDGTPPGPKEQALNPKKNRRTAPGPQDIDPSVTLARMLAPGNDRRRFAETKGAEIVGYVVKVEQGGHPETANCGNLTLALTDTHITVALGPTNDLTTTLVVEVTPWWRQEMKKQGIDWSTETLTQTITGKTVKFRGWLMFDVDHTAEAINTKPPNATKTPWRRTIWEIHPVTAMEIAP